MAKIIKAPAPLQDGFSVFLAGSIEMGGAENWQARVEVALSGTDITILNPRRDEWDGSWVQSIDNPQFREQVEWELAAQEHADIIVMYLAPSTRSPISLLELGLFGRTGKLVVCCPDGFWRKGNVDVVCARYAIAQVETIEALVAHVINAGNERG
jgi:hypothetical protein